MKHAPRLVVLISGQGTNLQALIDATKTHQINGQLVGVISNRSTALGLERARAAQIATDIIPFSPYKANANPKGDYDRALAETVQAYRPDLIVLAGFMRILTPVFLNAFSVPIINLHPALPGAYDGVNAMLRAWRDHEAGACATTGIMVHEVVEAVDQGPVLGTQSLAMDQFDSFEAFETAMHALEHSLLVDVVRNWCDAFLEGS